VSPASRRASAAPQTGYPQSAHSPVASQYPAGYPSYTAVARQPWLGTRIRNAPVDEFPNRIVRTGKAPRRRVSLLRRNASPRVAAGLVRRGALDRLAPVLTIAAALVLLLLPFAIMGDVAGLEVVNPMATVMLGLGVVTVLVFAVVGRRAARYTV
jgi:hypothetical protein